MQQITASARTVRELLHSRRYGIDYFQREYRWGDRQVEELLKDLTGAFLEYYEPGQERKKVAQYGRYFLGSIITSNKDDVRFLADGQQRLSTLTLLLIFLHRRLKAAGFDDPALEPMIVSIQFGQKQLNLDVPDRRDCMLALLAGQEFDVSAATEAVQRLKENYELIQQEFAMDEIPDEAMPFFADWLIDKVYLVEMAAASDEDAYTIFETVNDRGLSLTPSEMLKGHLLAAVDDESQRIEVGKIWREHVESLKRLDDNKEEDADAIKAWLRSQHAGTIRERKRDAKPQDFDRIGTEFHRWIKDYSDKPLGLKTSTDHVRFIKRDFAFYAQWYQTLRKASLAPVPGLEDVFANARRHFTLQFPLMLAPLTPSDSEAQAQRKVQVVAAFIDILLSRRIWANRSIDYSTLVYAMFLVMKDIRQKSAAEVAAILGGRLNGTYEGDKDTFEAATPFGNGTYRLFPSSRRPMHLMLAQMTDWMMRRCNLPSNLTDYLKRKGKGAFEIEHVWANKHDRYASDFPSEPEFQEHRNRIGALLLLPKTFNASYGAMTYEEKLPHYNGQNMLARTLGSLAYQNNPGLAAVNEELGGAFKAYPVFHKAQLVERQEAMRRLAAIIWTPERLQQIAAA